MISPLNPAFAFQIDLFDLNRHVRFAEQANDRTASQIFERTVLGFGKLLAIT
jgi:hypothetical protein